jgi:8-oxo-dGTP pyrophosphatase MutT (NUDIX family)
MTENVININGKKRRQRVEVFAIGKNNTVLVSLKGVGNYPELPGGGVDVGESLTAAGIRELEEESGWLAERPYQMNIPGNWIFRGKDDGWFNRDGWDEEENVAIVCDAIRFAPTDKYGSENDHHVFTLVAINKVIAETKKSITTATSERRRIAAEFRVKILTKVVENSIEEVLNKPQWTNW